MTIARSGRGAPFLRRKTLVQLVCVTGSLAGLVWLLGRIGWATIGSALARVGWPALAILMLLSWIETVADGAALWVVMGQRLRLGFAVTVNAAGSMLNLILPWESGEVLKGTLLREQFGTQPAISSTIIWNYVFKISRPTLSTAAALCGWALCRDTDGFILGVILAANALAFIPYLGLRLFIRYGAAAGFLRVLAFIPILRRHPGHWVEVAHQIDREVKLFWRQRPVAYLQVFFLQIVARMTGWASYFVALRALGRELQLRPGVTRLRDDECGRIRGRGPARAGGRVRKQFLLSLQVLGPRPRPGGHHVRDPAGAHHRGQWRGHAAGVPRLEGPAGGASRRGERAGGRRPMIGSCDRGGVVAALAVSWL
jgi:hypothetical protein